MTDETNNDVIVNVFGRTDVGRTREHNEDSFVVADLSTNIASLQPSVRTHKAGPKGTLFMVADGMGGAAAGEIASQMATEIVLRELREAWVPLTNGGAEAFATCIKRATQLANTQIHTYATSHQEYRGMGTTATIAGFLGDTLYLAQVGDSRGYLVRDGEVRQITKDQSLMQKLIEAGELTEEEAAQSERRNIILQALGPEAKIKVDLTYQPVRRGDVLLLCSDGLSGQITKDDILEAVGDGTDLVRACKRLIEMANEAGGPDNITVIVSRFDGEGLSEVGEGDEVAHRPFHLPEAGATPPMAMERIVEGPTLPMRPSQRQQQQGRATVPVDTPDSGSAGAPTATASSATTDIVVGDMPTDAPVAEPERTTWDPAEDFSGEPTVERRSRAVTIAIAVLVVLVAAATWYAYKTMKAPQPEAPPAASATTPAP